MAKKQRVEPQRSRVIARLPGLEEGLTEADLKARLGKVDHYIVRMEARLKTYTRELKEMLTLGRKRQHLVEQGVHLLGKQTDTDSKL